MNIFYLNKYNTYIELNNISEIIQKNLFFTEISLKSISSGNANFLTPKYEVLFDYMNFESLITKQILTVIEKLIFRILEVIRRNIIL